MAKKSQTLENGLTPKLNTVLEAVKSLDTGATADELFEVEAVKNACTSVTSVRSSLARLDKTLGLAKAQAELYGEKVTKRYFAN